VPKKSPDVPVLDQIPENLNVSDAAARLGCTKHWLYQEVAAGRLTPLKMGHRFVFPIEELLRYRSQLAEDSGCHAAVR
jgi:excisionase family DNA binding protein